MSVAALHRLEGSELPELGTNLTSTCFYDEQKHCILEYVQARAGTTSLAEMQAQQKVRTTTTTVI